MFGFSPYIYKLNDFSNTIAYHTLSGSNQGMVENYWRRTNFLDSPPLFGLPSCAIDVMVFTNPIHVRREPDE